MLLNLDQMLETAAASPQLQPWVVVVFFGLLGLCFGSFANVLIYRMPRQCLSIATPGSFCPACETPLKALDNIPLVSWIFLRGRCRYCGVRIPIRYPLVELLTGVAFAVLAVLILVRPDAAWANWLSGFDESFRAVFPESRTDGLRVLHTLETTSGGLWLLFAVWCAAVVALLVASWIDAQLMIIPDSISLGGAAVVLALSPWLDAAHLWGLPPEVLNDPFLFPEHGRALNAFLTTLVLMVGSAAVLWLVGLIGTLLFRRSSAEAGGAMGLGDAKLIMLMAGLLGWPKLLAAFAVAVLLAMVFGAPRLFQRYALGREVSTAIPFGPFLAGGTVVLMFAPAAVFGVLEGYLKLLGTR